MAFQFATDVARIVQGDPWTPTLVDQQGQPRVIKTGPNAGQPSPQYFVAVAIPKTSQLFPAWRAGVTAEAAAAWPSLFPQGPAGPCALPTFSWKILDGDDTTPSINPTTGAVSRNCDKVGWAGHWIVRFTSGFAPKVYLPSGPNVWTETTDRNLLKRGYYVRIGGNTTSNNNAQKPGLYMNFDKIEIVGGGPADEIVSGPDVATVFGGAPAALPPGVQAVTATGPATPPVPGAPPARVMLPAANGATYEQMLAAGWTDATLVANGMMAPSVAAAPPPAPAAPPPAPVAPPPAAPAPPPYTGYVAPPAAPARVMLAPANGATYEQMLAAGWTDATLVANGMMAG